MSRYDANTVYAFSDVADAAYDLKKLIERIRERGCEPDDHAYLMAWIPKQRKVLDEMEAVLTVKTPTTEDELQEILDFPEFSPKRWYIVTFREDPYGHGIDVMGRPMPLHQSGDQVTEMLDENHRLYSAVYVEAIAHIYEVNDDGTLTMKR